MKTQNNEQNTGRQKPLFPDLEDDNLYPLTPRQETLLVVISALAALGILFVISLFCLLVHFFF